MLKAGGQQLMGIGLGPGDAIGKSLAQVLLDRFGGPRCLVDRLGQQRQRQFAELRQDKRVAQVRVELRQKCIYNFNRTKRTGRLGTWVKRRPCFGLCGGPDCKADRADHRGRVVPRSALLHRVCMGGGENFGDALCGDTEPDRHSTCWWIGRSKCAVNLLHA